MKKLAIFGAGGHGAVISDILESLDISYIVIDDEPLDKELNGIKAISKEEFLSLPKAKEFGIILAIGDSKSREELYGFFSSRGFHLTSVIHPSAIVSMSANIANGVVVMPNVVVNARATINNGAILNSSSVIEHDCEVGEFVHIAPNATLCGNVFVGANSHIGAGSVVVEGKKVGENCMVGAGSVVICDIPPHSKVVGNPAKNFINKE